MAKFSRLFLGGILGAGLALLLAPKTGRELRSMLMGRMRPALPPAAEEFPPVPEEAPAADLQARIEETRRQVEAQLARTAPPEPVTVVEEESVTAEAVEEAVEAEAEEVETQTEVEMKEEEVAAEEAEEFSTLKTPAAGEPTLEEPPVAAAGEEAEEAAAETEPGRPEPSRFDQEEMRRRIDETRARLKAKAFDAMVGGETFIETEEKKGKQGEETEPSVDYGLEEEVERQLDEELREEP